MRNYKYFANAEENAYFTDVPCQFCGGHQFCLDCAFFERNDVVPICLDCFDKKRINVEIPDYIKAKIKYDANKKFEILKLNPPVPWIQNNDLPVCL